MAKRINIKGVIIPNDYKWIYDLCDMDSTCPNDVGEILNEAAGEDVEVYINSPGGIIDVGSEIYTALRAYEGEVKIYIVGQACSAASVIAMAGHCEMSPTSLMMVHCVSTYGGGNHNDFEHIAGVLKTADESIASAYMGKTGMSKEETIAIMEAETWLTAEQAKEKGLIDGIMFEDKEPLQLAAGAFGLKLPNMEQMEKVKNILSAMQEPPILGGFLDECCVFDAEERAQATSLYEAYCAWCNENDKEPVSQKMFGGQLSKLGFSRKRGTGGSYWWQGVGLAEEDSDGDSSKPLTDGDDKTKALMRAKLNLLKLKGGSQIVN